MKILISNDDGVNAPGIRMLSEALQALATVYVVAPDRERSGASNALTVKLPLRIHDVAPRVFAVDGTPTDCVNLGINQLMPGPPDLVVSGINSGANLGDDVLYSGTVAAAIEAGIFQVPAMAFSLVGADDGQGHFETAAWAATQLVAQFKKQGLAKNSVLNVNVPNVSQDQIQGFATTRLGSRHYAERTIKSEDPMGRPIYWIGPPGAEQDNGEGTDFHALSQNKVSVTPLKVDFTHYQQMDSMSQWLSHIPD